jgi:UDP-N-acetyl-D-mannosaminuronic acid dehydrogenase
MKDLISKDELIKKSDIIILGSPHSKYKNLKIPKKKYLIDTWGFFEK